jgi:hypothetical protein
MIAAYPALCSELAARLAELAPDKEFASNMWGRLAWAAELMRRARAEGRRAARSLTIQFVVGAAGESDRELLDMVDRIIEARREMTVGDLAQLRAGRDNGIGGTLCAAGWETRAGVTERV